MFKVEITSSPDREKLVAELWFQDELIAEVNQENGALEIEFYSNDKTLNNYVLDDLLTALNEAKQKLLNPERPYDAEHPAPSSK